MSKLYLTSETKDFAAHDIDDLGDFALEKSCDLDGSDSSKGNQT